MKIGMIFECGPNGPDRKICEHLARRINPQLKISSVTLDNKKKLVLECGKLASVLLKENCDKVIIVWDLHPAWRRSKPCRKEDREKIFSALENKKVPIEKLSLCVLKKN